MNVPIATCATLLLMLVYASGVHAQNSTRIAASESITPGYAEVFTQLMGLEPDPANVASVGGFILQRDVSTFEFDGGKIYLCKPVAGRVCAAIFVGDGSFSYTPPTDIERKQLGRFYEKESLQQNFKVLCLLFADSTYEELKGALKFGPDAVSPAVKEQIEKSLEYVSQEKYKDFDQSVMRSLLNHEHNNLFYAQIIDKPSDPIFFRIDPYEDEEVELLRRAEQPGGMHETDLVNQFHQQAYYTSDEFQPGEKDALAIDHYKVEATIADNLDFSASTTFDFRALDHDLRWADFELSPLLRLDSMVWNDGSPAKYFQTGTGVVWVECDRKFNDKNSGTLRMSYHGRLIDRKVDEFYLLDPHAWYPGYGYKKKATFDLTFRSPTRYKLASVGEKLSEEARDGITVSHWEMRTPGRNASFNIGLFKEYDIKGDTIPPITVLMSEGGHSAVAEAMIKQGETSGSEMEKQVGEDVENSCRLFEKIYGRPEATALYTTEIPYPHGEAFPGLIHLDWATFQRTDRAGFDHLFRAHEVAHQWWGIGVDFKSYHDQWLSEGFAEYSGLLYVQAVMHDNDKFFKILANYRKEILGNRKSIFGNGRQAGPIWLGYRTRSSSTGSDYDLIIYKKGAWVLHMLRNMLMDLTTMKEDKFFGVMSDFYTTYKGQDASTGDFERVVEKHVGGLDMSWFFNKWVLGTDVPSYTFAYKVSDTLDGKYKITCRIKQANVADNFQMYVPIKVEFGDNKFVRLRVLVQGKGAEVALPLMPMKPKEVIFNDLESVLCEVDTESW